MSQLEKTRLGGIILNLRNFLSSFNVTQCEECNLGKSQILMVEIHADWNDVRRARMIEEPANVSIEICIKAMLNEKL